MKIEITLPEEYTMDVLKGTALSDTDKEKISKKEVEQWLSILLRRKIDDLIAKYSKP